MDPAREFQCLVQSVKDRQAFLRGSWSAKPKKATNNGGKRRADGNPVEEDRTETEPARLTGAQILQLHRQAQTLGRPRILIIRQPDPSIFYENRSSNGSGKAEEQDSKTPAVFFVEAVVIGLPDNQTYHLAPTFRIFSEAEAQVFLWGWADRLTVCHCPIHGNGFISAIKNKSNYCKKCRLLKIDAELTSMEEKLELVDQRVCPFKIANAQQPWTKHWTIGEAMSGSQVKPYLLEQDCFVPKVSFHVEITGREDTTKGVSLKHYYGLVSIGQLHELTLPVVVGSHELSLADGGAEEGMAQHVLFFRSNLPPQPIRQRWQGKSIQDAEKEMVELNLLELHTRRRLEFKNLACPVQELAEFVAARMKKFAQVQIDFDERSIEQWATELEKAEKNHPGAGVQPGFCSWGAYTKSPWSSFFGRLLEEARKNAFTRKMLEERWIFQFMPWYQFESMIKTFVMKNPDYHGRNVFAIKISNDPDSLQATLAFYNYEKENTVRLYRCDLAALAEIHKVLEKLQKNLNVEEAFKFDFLLHPANRNGPMQACSFDEFPNAQKCKTIEEPKQEKTESNAPYFGHCQMNIPLFDVDDDMIAQAQSLLTGEIASAAPLVEWGQVPMDRRRVFHALVQSLKKELARFPQRLGLEHQGSTGTGITQTSPSHSFHQPSPMAYDQEEARDILLTTDEDDQVVMIGPQTFDCVAQMTQRGCPRMETAQFSFPSPDSLYQGSPEELGSSPGVDDQFPYRIAQFISEPDDQVMLEQTTRMTGSMRNMSSELHLNQGSESNLPFLDQGSVEEFFHNIHLSGEGPSNPPDNHSTNSFQFSSRTHPPHQQGSLFWEMEDIPDPEADAGLIFQTNHFQ